MSWNWIQFQCSVAIFTIPTLPIFLFKKNIEDLKISKKIELSRNWIELKCSVATFTIAASIGATLPNWFILKRIATIKCPGNQFQLNAALPHVQLQSIQPQQCCQISTMKYPSHTPTHWHTDTLTHRHTRGAIIHCELCELLTIINWIITQKRRCRMYVRRNRRRRRRGGGGRRKSENTKHFLALFSSCCCCCCYYY